MADVFLFRLLVLINSLLIFFRFTWLSGKQGLFLMGEEANGFIHDDDDFFTSSPLIEKHGKMTATVIGEKIYVIAESNDEGGQITVNILCKKDKKWSSPTILGTGPTSSKGHSAVLLNHERILILKHEASLDDCIWLLEVDTSSVNEQRKLLGTEVVAWSQGVVGDNLMPVVITGPSGVGKGTLISKLMEQFPSTFGFSVSHTTRRPREKETDGIHYHFTDRSIMEKDISDGKFLETASVHGNLYGTSLEAVERVASSGKRCILDIDVQGAKSVRASSLEAVFIFITPPSFEELEKRLRSRGTETEEQIQKRLRNAKSELEQGKCPGLFDHVLVNDDLGKCYETLKRILGLYGAEIMQLQRSKFPVCHSTRKAGQKWLLQCRSGESTKDFSTSFVLDASSVNGGFPGRTRDIYLSKADSLEFLKAESNGL